MVLQETRVKETERLPRILREGREGKREKGAQQRDAKWSSVSASESRDAVDTLVPSDPAKPTEGLSGSQMACPEAPADGCGSFDSEVGEHTNERQSKCAVGRTGA